MKYKNEKLHCKIQNCYISTIQGNVILPAKRIGINLKNQTGFLDKSSGKKSRVMEIG
jgi:hypothetical protein